MRQCNTSVRSQCCNDPDDQGFSSGRHTSKWMDMKSQSRHNYGTEIQGTLVHPGPCPWPNVLRRGGVHRDNLEPWSGRPAPSCQLQHLKRISTAVDMATAEQNPHALADRTGKIVQLACSDQSVGEGGQVLFQLLARQMGPQDRAANKG